IGEGERTERPTFGIAKSIKTALIVYLYCILYSTSRVLSPKFILQACITSLFLNVGRASAQVHKISRSDVERYCKYKDDSPLEEQVISRFSDADTTYIRISQKYFKS